MSACSATCRGPRVDVDDLRAAAAGLLEERAGDGVIRRRVGTGDDDDVGVGDVAVGGGHRARADALEQRCNRRGVTQPGAVVDVVRAEPGAQELLEEVGLFVGALGRAEPGDRRRGRRPRGSPSVAGRSGRAPRPMWLRGSEEAPRRSRRARRVCGRGPCPVARPSRRRCECHHRDRGRCACLPGRRRERRRTAGPSGTKTGCGSVAR